MITYLMETRLIHDEESDSEQELNYQKLGQQLKLAGCGCWSLVSFSKKRFLVLAVYCISIVN